MSLSTSFFTAKALMEISLTPSEFLKLSDSERENIKSVQIVPPTLGGKGFGKIKIVRKTPVYTVNE